MWFFFAFFIIIILFIFRSRQRDALSILRSVFFFKRGGWNIYSFSQQRQVDEKKKNHFEGTDFRLMCIFYQIVFNSHSKGREKKGTEEMIRFEFYPLSSNDGFIINSKFNKLCAKWYSSNGIYHPTDVPSPKNSMRWNSSFFSNSLPSNWN